MKALLFALALLTGQALAHEVKLEQSSQPASVLRLTYADGSAFAFEAYELYLPGKETPEQVGRTNALGQIVFLPGSQLEWRLKAFSGDGHGIDQRLRLNAAPVGTGSASTSSETAPPRWSLLLAGLGIIFGIFGLIQLIQRKKPQ